jgi:hypothetical protein
LFFAYCCLPACPRSAASPPAWLLRHPPIRAQKLFWKLGTRSLTGSVRLCHPASDTALFVRATRRSPEVAHKSTHMSLPSGLHHAAASGVGRLLHCVP